MAQTVTPSIDRQRIKVAAGAGDTPEHVFLGIPQTTWVVSASPGGGGTMSVEATWSDPADVNTGNGVWHTWDAGTVSAKANQLLYSPTAVRFTATTAAGTGEVAR